LALRHLRHIREGAVSSCEEFAHRDLDNKTFGSLRLDDYNFQKIWRGSKAADYRSKVGNASECRGCTLESQGNYPAILVSFKSLIEADRLALTIRANSRGNGERPGFQKQSYKLMSQGQA